MTSGAFANGPQGSGSVNLPYITQGTVQVVAYTTHAESSAFGATTTLVRLIATTACHVLFGSAPVATTSNGVYLAANVPEYFTVVPGQKVSVVQVSSGGNLHICEAA